MGINGVSAQTSVAVQSLINLRSQLDDLQRQMGTGQKSDTYAGLGVDRGLAVGLQSRLNSLSGYDSAISMVNVRLQIAQTTLGRLSDIGSEVKNSALQQPTIDGSGSTLAQSDASNELGEILGLLNTQAGNRYMFSGKATDQPSVESLDHIMNGNGAQAGFKQVAAERQQADLGSNGLGRLVISAPTATSVAVAEDAVSPFGFKLAAANSTLTGATVTGPSGSPSTFSVDLGATNPNPDDTLQLRFTLPDGSSESVTLTATASSNPGPNEFTIGATPSATATNLQSALTGSIGQLANTSLKAASAVAASNDFFNIDDAHPPQRVAGPPFDTATSLVNGTSANTVTWYTGDAGSDPARGTATATVDSSITVSYGMRANEQGIRSLVQNVAALAVTTYSPTDPNGVGEATALGQRVATALDNPPGTQKIQDIEADLAGAQTTLAAATDRHQQTKNTLSDMLDQITGVSNEQVAAEILALQTRLQASMQTTALLAQTSLVNYLPAPG